MTRKILILNALVFSLLLFSCEDKREILPVEKTASVAFSIPSVSIPENATQGLEIKLSLSVPASADGAVDLQLLGGKPNSRFVTQPAFDANFKLRLPVSKGSTELSFKVMPVDDHLYNGTAEFRIELVNVVGDLVIGSNKFLDLRIIDNELSGKLKSFETSGMGSYRREFEYSHLGKINRVAWQSNLNQALAGQYKYLYNDAGNIVRINSDPDRFQQIFFYEGGKLRRSEKSNSNDFTEYEVYSFDGNNFLTGIETFRRIPGESDQLTSTTVFSYFSSGSVHTITTYAFEAPVSYRVIKKVTYEDYIQKSNPLPYYQDIPGLPIQHYLPQRMIVEEHGTTFTYQFEYQFDGNNQVKKRITTGPSGVETTQFHYY
jgi:hypothetical protein